MKLIASIGDSTTQNGYPTDLQNCLGTAYQVGNYGLGGSGIQNTDVIAYSASTQYTGMLADHADLYISMFGVNDSIAANWTTGVSEARFVADYEAMITAIKAATPAATIWVLTPFYCYTNTLGANETLINTTISTLVRQVATNTGSTLVDMNVISANQPGLSLDGVHPNAAGNLFVANQLCTRVLALYGGTAASGSSSSSSSSSGGSRSMSCGSCGSSTNEMTFEAWIQPCDGQTPLFSNTVDGKYPAIDFTNLSPARKGKKTKKRKKDSRDGSWVVCLTTEDAPGDATVDVEIQACGCGGYAPRELEDEVFNAFIKYFCCGSLVRTQVVTGIDLPNIKVDKLTDYTAALEQKFTYSGALFDSEYDIYPLSFSEVAASSGLTSGTWIRDVTYYGAAKGCGNSCGKGCTDRWAAISDTGDVIYQGSATSGLGSVTIPAYSNIVSALGSAHIAEYNGKLYVTYADAAGAGYWYATLNAAGVPGSWTKVQVFTGTYVVIDAIATNDGVVILMDNASSVATLVTITNGGQYATSVASNGTALQAIDACGTVQIAGAANGAVFVKGCNGTWAPTATAPAAVALYAVGIRTAADFWATDGLSVYKSSDSGATWSTVGMPSATNFITGIQWANNLTGYIICDTPAKIFATVDGGATWEDATDRIASGITAANHLSALAIPCCSNPTLAVNSVLVAGQTTTLKGGVWQGRKQTC